jgi:hypothetical protein
VRFECLPGAVLTPDLLAARADRNDSLPLAEAPTAVELQPFKPAQLGLGARAPIDTRPHHADKRPPLTLLRSFEPTVQAVGQARALTW